LVREGNGFEGWGAEREKMNEYVPVVASPVWSVDVSPLHNERRCCQLLGTLAWSEVLVVLLTAV
jgi:hypothetical protein